MDKVARNAQQQQRIGLPRPAPLLPPLLMPLLTPSLPPPLPLPPAPRAICFVCASPRQVKKSRENAKVRKMEHERLCTEREAENQKLASEVTRLREEVSFLTKVLRNPKALNSQEQHLVELLLSSVEDLSAKVGGWGRSLGILISFPPGFSVLSSSSVICSLPQNSHVSFSLFSIFETRKCAGLVEIEQLNGPSLARACPQIVHM